MIDELTNNGKRFVYLQVKIRTKRRLKEKLDGKTYDILLNKLLDMSEVKHKKTIDIWDY